MNVLFVIYEENVYPMMVNSTTTIDKSNIHLSPLTIEGIYLRIYLANSFSYQMIFMLFNSNATGATSEAGFISFLIHDLSPGL